MERLDPLQNFLLSEILDIKAEMKNKCNQMTSKEISAGNDEMIELLQNQIIYLRKQCNFKNQLINVILENVFKSDMPKVTCYKSSNTLLTPNDDYQFPERYRKNNHQKSSCSSCTHDNRFRAMRMLKIAMKIYKSESHHVKQHILTTIKIKNIRPEKLPGIDLLIGNSAIKIFQ